VVVLAGVAELVSGAISMGAGGYLSAKTEYDHAVNFRKTTSETLSSRCSREKESEVITIMDRFGVSEEVSALLCKDLAQDQEKLLNFILQLGHEIDDIAASRVYISAITIGLSYLLGGLIPLLPYIFCHHLTTALFISIGVTGFTLFVFGAVKQQLVDLDKQNSRTGWSWFSSLYGALSTLAVGGAAAGASYGIVRGVESRMGGGVV
jgi:VIT1/CCC1 family predicted Fe2+/Mn2+ transporter